jgi:glycosyltransferase 2 family protein
VIRRRALTFARLAAGIAVVAIVLHRADVTAVATVVRDANPLWLLVAFSLNLLAVLGSAAAWRALLEASNPPRLMKLYRSYLVGLFYNNLGVGTAVGDSVRAAHLWSAGTRPAKAIVSVVAERIISVLSLLGLASVGALYFVDDRPHLAVAVWSIAACGLLLTLTACLVAEPLLRAIPRRGSEFVLDALQALAWLRRNPPTVGTSAIYGVAVQICTVLATMCVLASVGVWLSPIEAVAVVPVMALFILLPISIQGIGVREASYMYFLGMLGIASQDAVAAALLSYLSTVGVTLVGGMVLLAGVIQARRTAPQSIAIAPGGDTTSVA